MTDAADAAPPPLLAGRPVSLALSGGLALGAYHWGGYEALHAAGGRDGPPRLARVAGCSSGAIMAAILAGNPPERRAERLAAFWEGVSGPSPGLPGPATASDPWGGGGDPFSAFAFAATGGGGPWRRSLNAASIGRTVLAGRPGLFRPRPAALALPPGADPAPGLYDLAPLAARLTEIVDFDRINDPRAETPRLALGACDLETGERVAFDTGRGDRIGPEHVLASCALLPLLAPVEVGGRLLGDGGLLENTPLDLLPDDEAPEGEAALFALDLFGRAGSRPGSLDASLARALDLAFAGQSAGLLDLRRAERRLRARLAELAARLPPEAAKGGADEAALADALGEARAAPDPAPVLHLGYRAGPGEAGGLKGLDFSAATLAGHREAGARDMRAALAALPGTPRGAVVTIRG